MKAIIFVSAKAALLEGLDNQGEYTIEFNPADLTEEQRTVLAKCDSKNDAFILTKAHPVARPDIESMRAILNFEIELAAKKKTDDIARAKNDFKQITDWAANPPEKNIVRYNNYGSFEIKKPYIRYAFAACQLLGLEDSGDHALFNHFMSTDPIVKEAYEDAESLVFWLNLDETIKKSLENKSYKLYMAEQERELNEEAKKNKRKSDQIKAWVEKNGTDSQKLRYKEGYLLDKEIIDSIRDDAYKNFDGFERYKKLNKSDICSVYDDDYSNHDVTFDVEPAEHLTEDEYEMLLRLRKIQPSNVVEPRRHTAVCGDCDERVERIGFKVNIIVGDFDFSREYGL